MAGPSGTTPIYGFPFPTPDDTVDVPRDVQALAMSLDGMSSLRPPLVTSLSGSPVDGQEVYYLADATAGVIWHLRYRAASGSTYKWELIGGSPVRNGDDATVSTGSTTFVALTGGPAITVPLAGDYDIELSAWIQPPAAAAQLAIVSFSVGAAAATDTDGLDVRNPAAGNLAVQTSRTVRKTGIAASTTLTAMYRSSGATANFLRRWMRIIPVRVG